MDTQKKTTQDARQGGFKRGGSRPGGRPMAPREKPEFEQKIIAIRRVTRVVSGGRRMSFSVAMVIGDKKGSVGLGTGKAVDTALAIAKALKSAKKNLIKIKVTKYMSIARPVEAKYCSSKVSITPNKAKGIVSGSAVRDVVNLAGLKNVTTKIHSGSKNKLNNAGAALKALAEISEKRSVREVLKEE